MEQDVTQALRREEQIALALRALYEQYGFRKYRMGKFEEYELYMENKNFLKNPNIITFHDLDGKLMALKPDVTLSIAKNTRANAHSSEKVYYQENVYWLEKQSGGYKEVNQLGLESIGRLDALSYYEVLCLAQETLAAISGSHWMQVSHIGFWVALLDGLSIEEGMRRELFSCIHGKRLHELRTLLEGTNTAPFAIELIMQAASLCGEFAETLAAARRIAISNGMTDALNELETVYGLLEQKGWNRRMTLDFSLVNDCDYYDGLIFQGYVEGVPRALLSGGYYGRLMRKFGRNLDAIGFAVYMNELDVLFRSQRGADVDTLILYDDQADVNALVMQADSLRAKGGGLRVRVEKQVPEGIRCENIYRFTGAGLEEVGKDA
ncbi:MAG: ATP phosphoribosyltransferase regulatory subunit [Clostridia bacterium]|nr:ATP phosphoribosyltransferase regulatory subunit [Clostridia bacterium]